MNPKSRNQVVHSDKPFQKPRLKSQFGIVNYVTQRVLDHPNDMWLVLHSVGWSIFHLTVRKINPNAISYVITSETANEPFPMLYAAYFGI